MRMPDVKNCKDRWQPQFCSTARHGAITGNHRKKTIDDMIENINKIDVFGVRKDGGADLVIVSSGKLDESIETQKLLLDKVETYLGYINSQEFHDECPQAGADNTYIILRLDEEPPALIRELITKIIPWAAGYHAKFVAKIRK